MRYSKTTLLALLLLPFLASAQKKASFRKHLPTDSIELSDPFVLADAKTKLYYMTGTGGKLWKSKDLNYWDGPYEVAKPDPNSWMGPNPMIWAAEIHPYKGRYYYFATFTNRKLKIASANGDSLERRASHVLVSNNPDGPFLPMADSTYLPANKSTLDATFWIENNKPYMIYCHEWVQNQNGTVEEIEMKPDLSGTLGIGTILFRASDAPWSRENTKDGSMQPNKVTDGPYLFRTNTGRLGMIWTSWIYDVYTQGIAYSQSGTLGGPWLQEAKPITPPNFGHGMIFKTFEGKTVMSLHSHVDIKGHYHRVPHFFEVDISGDKLVVRKQLMQ